MADNLKYTLNQVYNGTINSASGIYHNYSTSEVSQSAKYLEIPITEDIFEIPIFALQSFLYAVGHAPNTTSIVAILSNKGLESKYKTAAKALECLLKANFKSSLVSFKITQGEEVYNYYITHGAIFDGHFQPVMICSWRLQKVSVPQNDAFVLRYKPLKPVLRISPNCYLWQSNPIEKIVSKKISSIVLSDRFAPNKYFPNVFSYEDFQDSHAEVIIGDNPFRIISTSPPTVNTTNSELLEVAKEHIDEMVNHDYT